METTYNKDIAHCSGYCCLLSDQCRRYHLFRAWERRKLPPAPFIMTCFDMDTETCPNFLHYGTNDTRKMGKKKIVITLSRVFPTTHSRKGQPTGFKEKLASGCKLHTIRGNFDQWNAIAEKMQRGGYCLSIRQWSGRPYNSPQVEIAHLDQPIGIQRIELHYHSENDTITACIDGREWIDADCYEIAKNDGLNTTDFKEWFFGRHPKGDKVFHGVIIHFTDFRY